MDLSFEKILEKLKEIHKDYPDLRFGLVIQTAMDYKEGANVNLHDRSSKAILLALKDYKEKIKQQRGEK